MQLRTGNRPTGIVLLALMTAVFMAAAILAIFFLAPMEASMGEVQRIFYVHVAVAWSALMAFLFSAMTSAIYLFRRNLAWDHWSQAAAELGWLGCALVLITGSLWAKAAWGDWWTWDPRLTTTFILWMVFSGYFLVRNSLEDAQQRARLGAVMSILGVLDLPLVFIATRWFRGIHPVSHGLDPSMQAALILSLVSFSTLFALLISIRKTQLQQARELRKRESELDMNLEFDSSPPMPTSAARSRKIS